MFKFDKKRAEEILGIIYEAHMAHTHLFRWVHANNGSAPQQKYIPAGVEKRSLEHQRFLFFCSLMTYSSQSEQGVKQCVKVYAGWPELFNKKVDGMTVLKDIFKANGFIYPNAIAQRWHGSNRTLFKKYEGEPLKIFYKKNSINEVLLEKAVKGKNLLPGFGPKIFSLLALWYEELGLVSLADAFPCDLHVQNECLGLDIATSSETRFRTTGFAEFLREKISEVCREKGFKPLLLSHAMWFLGSLICIKCKKKPFQAKDFCPVYSFCSGRVSTRLYRSKGEWDIEVALPGKLPLFDL